MILLIGQKAISSKTQFARQFAANGKAGTILADGADERSV